MKDKPRVPKSFCLKRRGLRIGLAAAFGCLLSGQGVGTESALDSASGLLSVQRRGLVRTTTLSGTIQAAESVTITSPSIASQWNFTITYLIEEGSQVKPGDLLAEFDASQLELNRLDAAKRREEARLKIAQKEAEIEGRRQDLLMQVHEARKNLSIAELNIGIDSRLIPRAELEKNEFEHSKAQVALEKAQERLQNLEEGVAAEMEVVRLEFQQADLELKRIQSDISKMRVTAPSPGLVLYQENWSSGRKMQVGDQIYRGQPLIHLPNLDQLVVETTVHHADVARLRLEAAAKVVIDAYPGQVFEGRVLTLPEIAKARTSRSQFKSFKFKVWLDEMNPALMKPGMTARVQLFDVLADALTVPRRTLRIDSSGQSFVLRDADPPQRVDVEVVDSNDVRVAVEGRLTPGERLLDAYSQGRSEGAGSVEWIAIKRDDLTFNVSGTGQLSAAQAVYVRPPSLPNAYNFKIARMAPEGIQVKQGDFLIQFDPTEFMQRLRDEQSNLAKVRKELEKNQSTFKIESKDLELELENAKVELEKAENKLLQAREFQAGRDVKQARYEAEFARFKLESLQKKFESRKSAQELQLQTLRDSEAFYEKRVESNRKAVEALTVTAPISGVLVYQTNWNNEKKKVGDQVYMSENIFGIPNLETLGIQGHVSEVDAGRLAVGQHVAVTLDALPDEAFRGTIAEIGTIFKQASFDQPSRILDIQVELEEIDVQRMRPGMAARLQIAVDRFEDVIAVPISVLQLEDNGAFVWVREGEGAVKRKVEVGQDNGIVAIIESGLENGEEIASRPLAEEAE